jgi:uncharacterized membrane protein YccC
MEGRFSTSAARIGSDVQRLPAAASAAMPHILFGLRLWASVSLALLVAYWLQLDDAFWAGTSASVVAQPGLGASLRKGRYRAIGTILGALVMVLLTAVFPQSHPGLLFSLTLWGAICGLFATILPNFAGYGAALAGYTAAVVFANAVNDPGNVFLVAVTRTIEIGIGIFSAGLVHALTDFGDARRRLRRALADIGRDIAAGLTRTLAAEPQMLDQTTARRELIRRVTALGVTIDEAIGEPSQLRIHPGGLQAAVEALFTALSAWRGIANHLDTVPFAQGRAAGAAFLPAISKVAQTDWLNDPVAVRDMCGIETQRVLQLPAADLSARILLDGSARTLRALERAANGMVLVATPGSERPDRGGKRLHVPDFLPAMLNGLRVVAALFSVELFWIATAWPDGPTMITFTAVAVILFSPRAEAAYPSVVEYAVGTAVAGGLAAILGFVVLPSLHGGFLSLSLTLGCVLVPLGTMSAGPWRKLAFMAMVTNLLPILAIENHQPSYDGARFLNAAVAISAGTVAAAIFMRLLPGLPPARRIQRLLALTLRDLRRLAVRRARFEKEAWIGLVSQRLAAMPEQATLEQEAQLLASLSVGEASIALLEARPHLPGGDALDHAFACLAEANVAGSRDWLTRFCAQQAGGATPEAQRGMYAAVQATLIADALTRHTGFFASVA